MMDTIEIFSHVGKAPTFKVHPCTERGAFRDPVRPRPAELETDVVFQKELKKLLMTHDVWSHMADSYEAWMSFFREAGYGKLLEAPLVDVNSSEYKRAAAQPE